MIKAKERPIIFSTPLIPSIQNLKPDTWPPEPIDPGKPWKWQTRRIIKAPVLSEVRQPDEVIFDGNVCEFAWHGNDVAGGFKIKCPYPPGTRLWVKETWQEGYNPDNIDKNGDIPLGYCYKASDHDISAEFSLGRWRSPRFMPKAAARLWLEVRNVRVERVQGITEEDVTAEGLPYRQSISNSPISTPADGKWYWGFPTPSWNGGIDWVYTTNAKEAYKELWNPLNAKRGYPWENNDWVWVYEFMRIE